jgi:acylphosphatase
MALRLLVTGLVQGVGYRETMRREAAALGVNGWVRNRPDGSVEAMVDGPPDAVRALIDWAWRGPRAARVAGVKTVGVESTETLAGFEIRPTS